MKYNFITMQNVIAKDLEESHMNIVYIDLN